MRNLAYTFRVIYDNLLCGSSVLDQKIAAKEQLDLGDFMLRLTFDTIVQSAFDAKVSTLLEDGRETTTQGLRYMHVQEEFLKITAANLLNPLKRLMFWSKDNMTVAAARAFKVGFAERLIQVYHDTHTAEYLESDTSIMGHLLRNPYKDKRDRISDMMVFVSAGHETTSWTLVWLFLEIARHPEVKAKLQAELDAHIPSRSNQHGHSKDDVAFPSISALMALPFLTMCIKEAMRLWPVAASGPRRVVAQDLEFTTNAAALDPSLPKVRIPKNSTVQVNFFTIFRAGWIDRAEEFVPERWSPENPQLPRLKEMFMPFSLGRRNCVGQNLANVELTMIAAYLLRYYDFRLVSEPQLELFLSFKATNVLMELSHRP
jgi:cytochrome P450